MLIHDRFVFIHVPKTGGTFVRRMLREELPECRQLDDPDGSAHYGWDRIPKEARGRPVLAFVRNPWDWYVSWYTFAVNQPAESFERRRATQPLFRRLFADGGNRGPEPGLPSTRNRANDFAVTIRRACTGIVDSKNPVELEPMVRGFDLAKPLMEGYDFYTSRLRFTVGDAFDSDLATIGRFESLLDDLEAFLETTEVDLPDGAMARIRKAEPRNTTTHAHYREYYDEELRDLVGSSCRKLIEQFKYRF